MRKVYSAERSTKMNATRYSAVLVDGTFVVLSNYPGAIYTGRVSGVEHYEADVPDNAIVASFYRSNRGNERVSVEDGPTFGSFAMATQWGKEKAGIRRTDHKCPTCGCVI